MMASTYPNSNTNVHTEMQKRQPPRSLGNNTLQKVKHYDKVLQNSDSSERQRHIRILLIYVKHLLIQLLSNSSMLVITYYMYFSEKCLCFISENLMRARETNSINCHSLG